MAAENVMANSLHAIGQEELMAYLDGELSVDQAAKVAGHMEECAECRARAAEFGLLAERLTGWQVEQAPASLSDRVMKVAASSETKAPNSDKSLAPRVRFPQFALPRWAWATAAGVCATLIGVAVLLPGLYRSRPATTPFHAVAESNVENAPAPAPPPVVPSSATEREVEPRARGGGGAEAPISVPMIARTASLTLVAKDFDRTRAALEDVVRRHHGYSGQLTVGSESGSARTLSATFRVPADQLDATLAEIKQLAHVDRETQGGEEVTDQYVDLTARLSNARRTEQTLLDVLEKRAGKLSDVLAVEEELARVREEIERMDAERKNLENRVSYATLQVELHEEYKAQLEIAPSIGRRVGNALVEGFRTAADSIVSLVLFLLNVGPFLLLWALILFLPVRYGWRRLRAALARK